MSGNGGACHRPPSGRGPGRANQGTQGPPGRAHSAARDTVAQTPEGGPKSPRPVIPARVVAVTGPGPRPSARKGPCSPAPRGPLRERGTRCIRLARTVPMPPRLGPAPEPAVAEADHPPIGRADTAPRTAFASARESAGPLAPDIRAGRAGAATERIRERVSPHPKPSLPPSGCTPRVATDM